MLYTPKSEQISLLYKVQRNNFATLNSVYWNLCDSISNKVNFLLSLDKMFRIPIVKVLVQLDMLLCVYFS
jgi:hypothetical protein